jgi:hypothetical protein
VTFNSFSKANKIENQQILSRVMREEIIALKDWAKNRARPANTQEDKPKDQRKIRQIPNVS